MRTMPRRWRATLAALLASSFASSSAAAQTLDCTDPAQFPCGLQIERAELVEAPPILRVQARVAQLKQFVPEGVFDKAVVNVMHGATAICTETFEDVKVTGSVLNLLIGPEMDCAVGGDLGDVLETRDALSLRLCFPQVGVEGTPDSACLDDIALGTTPNAIKATLAHHALKAHRVQRAGQAHQAHRFAADRDLGDELELNHGYFELRERNVGDLSALGSVLWKQLWVGNLADYGGAVLEWAAVQRPSQRSLHLAARTTSADDGAGLVKALRRLWVLATTTWTQGHITVAGHPSEPGFVVQNKGLEGAGNMELNGDVEIAKQLHVYDGQIRVDKATDFAGDLDISYGISGSLNDGNLLVGSVSKDVATTVGEGVSVHYNGMTSPATLTQNGRLEVDALTVNQTTTTRVVRTGGPMQMVAGTTGHHDVFVVTGGDLVINPSETLNVSFDGDMRALFGGTFNGTLKYDGILTDCEQGYLKDASGNCKEIDECALGSDGCPAGCINTPGSFECVEIRHIWVSSVEADGEDIDAAAIAGCAADAASKGYGPTGVWLAGKINPAALTDAQFQLPSGEVIAKSLADLLDGTLLHPINQTLSGALYQGPVWSGLSASGAPAGPTCKGWTEDKDCLFSLFGGCVGHAPVYGQVGLTTSNLTAWSSAFTAECTSRLRAYCVEL